MDRRGIARVLTITLLLLGCASDDDGGPPDAPPVPTSDAAIDAGGLCAGVECDVGMSCDPMNGMCRNPCEGVMCPPGEACVMGVCY